MLVVMFSKFRVLTIIIISQYLLGQTIAAASNADVASNTIDGTDTDNEVGLPLTDEQCLEFGFRRSEVQCFRCQDLVRFDLKELQESCLKCCQQKEETATPRKYASAVMEICACNLGHYPQVQAFVKSDRPKAFPKLTVKHVPGQHPTIKMRDSKGFEVEEMSIRKWDTDTIEEFLREHLIN